MKIKKFNESTKPSEPWTVAKIKQHIRDTEIIKNILTEHIELAITQYPEHGIKSAKVSSFWMENDLLKFSIDTNIGTLEGSINKEEEKNMDDFLRDPEVFIASKKYNL